eukprot:2355315-Rhodomonas_salina.1
MPYSGLLEPRGGSKVTLKLGGTVPDTRAPPRRARLQVGLRDLSTGHRIARQSRAARRQRVGCYLRCWLLGCGRGWWLTPGAASSIRWLSTGHRVASAQADMPPYTSSVPGSA